MEQAGVLADDLAVVRVSLAQHRGDRAFHDFDPLAVKARQVRHQPGALTQRQQQRRGVFHQTPLEALLAVTKQALGAQAITPVAQAAIDPALLLQGQQHARHRGLGQARQVMQLLQPQSLMLTQQLDNRQGALDGTHATGFCLALHRFDLPKRRWMITLRSKMRACPLGSCILQTTGRAALDPLSQLLMGIRQL
ncbi:hypothetical protein D3C85_1212120 [compost metagenome]